MSEKKSVKKLLVQCIFAYLHSLVSIQTVVELDLISVALNADSATSESDRFGVKLII